MEHTISRSACHSACPRSPSAASSPDALPSVPRRHAPSLTPISHPAGKRRLVRPRLLPSTHSFTDPNTLLALLPPWSTARHVHDPRCISFAGLYRPAYPHASVAPVTALPHANLLHSPHPVAPSLVFSPHSLRLSCIMVIITLRARSRRSPLRAVLEHFVAHSELVNWLNGDARRAPSLFSLIPDQQCAVPRSACHPARPRTPT